MQKAKQKNPDFFILTCKKKAFFQACYISEITLVNLQHEVPLYFHYYTPPCLIKLPFKWEDLNLNIGATWWGWRVARFEYQHACAHTHTHWMLPLRHKCIGLHIYSNNLRRFGVHISCIPHAACKVCVKAVTIHARRLSAQWSATWCLGWQQ